MLPAIVLSRGCKEPSHNEPSKSTHTILEIKSLIYNGAILVVGKGFMPHFFQKDENLSPQEKHHQEEIRHLIKTARDQKKLWQKEDIPFFVTNENPQQEVFKFVPTIFLQSKEYAHSKEWETLAFRRGFDIQGYNVKIRSLSQGTKDIETSFSNPFKQGESIENIGHQLRPMIHWCTSITIYDGYSVENHRNSSKEKKMVSGLSNFFRWVIDERKEMKTHLNRIRVIQRKYGKIRHDVRTEMTEVFSDLVKDCELHSIVKSSPDSHTGIFLGFRSDKMAERYIVFERNGLSLTYTFGGHYGFEMLRSTERKMESLTNFKISGPVEFEIKGTDGRKLISDMNNQGQFIQYPFDKTSNF